MTKYARSIFYYFIFLTLIGNVFISITPAFEGFDELAHFSAIRQLSSSNFFVANSDSYIDQALVDYSGPEPYTSGEPPFDSGKVYWKFFESSSVLTEEYISKYRANSFSTPFIASNIQNHEYRQHPPLYYLLVGILYPVLDGVSLLAQIFSLRLFSYLLSLLGIFFGILSVLKMGIGADKERGAEMFGFFIYPVIFPMFVPQFARIGNDSLCLLIVGLLSYVIAIWAKENFLKRYGALIGVLLGLGCLTKAFFLPISAGIVFYIAVAIMHNKNSDRLRFLANLILIFSLSLLFGGWWYIRNYIEYGSLTGANIAISLNQVGGIWSNLHIIIANFYLLARGLVTIFVTFIWAGSFSLTHIPYYLYLPSLFIMGLALYRHLTSEFNAGLRNAGWILNWILVFFFLGLFWHAVLNMIAGSGNGNTPGWYLHILAPFVAPALGVSLWDYYSIIKNTGVIRIIYFYYVLFIGLIISLQISLFLGIAEKSIEKGYAIRGQLDWQNLFPTVFSRLEILGYPIFAIVNLLALLFFYRLISKKNV